MPAEQGVPHSGAALLRRTSVFAEGENLGAGGIHFRRAFEIPKGGAALWAAEPKKKGLPIGSPFFLVRLKGFEPPTYWFVASHSIQLSYSRKSLVRLVSP